VPNSGVAQSLGRNLSGSAPDATINIVRPGTMRGDRINELDIRVAKILRLGTTRTMLAVDVYNLLNSNAALTYNPTFVAGGRWPQPSAIQKPRVLELTAEFDF
jgi:hypothetical protein